MKHVVEVIDGHIVYDGVLTKKEIASVDEILNSLKEEIPQIEDELKNKYKNGVWYKYYLGIFLGELLDKYEISIQERRRFWDEIKELASKEERKREEGKNSETRSFYYQCYRLSLLSPSVVEKLSWRQWQSFLDRVAVRADERVFLWIEQLDCKISGADWREFEKALNLYLKDKDTSVFDNEELFSIYDSILLMANFWLKLSSEYQKAHPASLKVTKSKKNWSIKYYQRCLLNKRKAKLRAITEDICVLSFNEIMV